MDDLDLNRGHPRFVLHRPEKNDLLITYRESHERFPREELPDPDSEVHRLAHLDRHYSLLAAVGTQPRTTYLGKIRNPNPSLAPAEEAEGESTDNHEPESH